MTDVKTTFTAEEIARLIAGLGQVLETACPACPDDRRGELAGKLAHWILSDKTMTVSPDKLLPKAKYFLSFNVVDETNGEHIVRLTLERSREMTDGDFMQIQNFFWVTVGRAIRDNPEIIRALHAGGIRVEVDPPMGHAPDGASPG